MERYYYVIGGGSEFGLHDEGQGHFDWEPSSQYYLLRKQEEEAERTYRAARAELHRSLATLRGRIPEHVNREFDSAVRELKRAQAATRNEILANIVRENPSDARIRRILEARGLDDATDHNLC